MKKLHMKIIKHLISIYVCDWKLPDIHSGDYSGHYFAQDTVLSLRSQLGLGLGLGLRLGAGIVSGPGLKLGIWYTGIQEIVLHVHIPWNVL